MVWLFTVFEARRIAFRERFRPVWKVSGDRQHLIASNNYRFFEMNTICDRGMTKVGSNEFLFKVYSWLIL